MRAVGRGPETSRLGRWANRWASLTATRSRSLRLRVDGTLRDRAANGRYGWAFNRGQDFAAGIWVIDPIFMLDTVRQQIAAADSIPAREERYFGGARLDDDDLRDAAEDDRQRRATDRARHAEATAGNLGLGHDMRAALETRRRPAPNGVESTVDLDVHRSDSDLVEFDLGDEDGHAA